MRLKTIKRVLTYCLIPVMFFTSANLLQAGSICSMKEGISIIQEQEEVVSVESPEEIIVTENTEEVTENSNELSVDSLSGSGTQEDPYYICDAVGLRQIGENLTAYYELASNIDLGGEAWTPIGTSSTPFAGHVDGNGYTISNFNISTDVSFTGFFGFIRNAKILELSLDNFHVEGIRYVGGLSGCAYGSETAFTDCHILNGTVSGVNDVGGMIGYCNSINLSGCTSNVLVEANGSSSDSHTGGILGYNYRGTVTRCCYTGTVNSVGNAGGLAGFSYTGTFEECYSTGEIVGTKYVGGLVGYFGTAGTIKNSFSIGKITGTKYVGGISGYSGKIVNSYCAGKISGTESVYGIGYNASIANCYYDTTINQLTTNITSGRITTQMIQEATYSDWDFENVWEIIEGKSYPFLTGVNVPDGIYAAIATIKGSLVNGKTGSVIVGATVVIREEGETEMIDTVTTDASGMYIFENAILDETYTLEVIADGFVSKEITITCTGEEINAGYIVLIPVTTSDTMTVILSWGATPGDLDTHFQGGNYHVFYSSKTANGAVLDLDDTSSYGPETLTLNINTLPVGTYQYYIHWFSGTGTWGNSNANVEVYLGNEHINSFQAPSSMASSSGGQWKVFNLVISDNPNSVSAIDKHIATVSY